jgi:hypothetical protein
VDTVKLSHGCGISFFVIIGQYQETMRECVWSYCTVVQCDRYDSLVKFSLRRKSHRYELGRQPSRQATKRSLSDNEIIDISEHWMDGCLELERIFKYFCTLCYVLLGQGTSRVWVSPL